MLASVCVCVCVCCVCCVLCVVRVCALCLLCMVCFVSCVLCVAVCVLCCVCVVWWWALIAGKRPQNVRCYQNKNNIHTRRVYILISGFVTVYYT